MYKEFFRFFKDFWRNLFALRRRLRTSGNWKPTKKFWGHCRPPNSLGGQIWPQVWNLCPKLHMLPCLFGLFCSFLDQWRTQLASTKVVGFAATKNGKGSRSQWDWYVINQLNYSWHHSNMYQVLRLGHLPIRRQTTWLWENVGVVRWTVSRCLAPDLNETYLVAEPRSGTDWPAADGE